MKLGNMRIGTRLGAAFTSLILGAAAIAAVGIVALQSVNERLKTINEDRYPKIEKAADMELSVNIVARAVRNLFLVGDRETFDKEAARIVEAQLRQSKNIEWLERVVNTERGKALLARIKASRGAYETAQQKSIELARAGRRDEGAGYLLGEVRNKQSAYIAVLQEFVGYQRQAMQQAGQSANSEVADRRAQMLGLGGATLALSMLLAFLTIRGLLRELGGEPGDAAAVANRVAAGDLATAIALKPGDGASVMAAMARMQGDLKTRIEADASIAAESLRVKDALDRVTSCVMIADVDGKIIYMNRAAQQMFRDGESDIRRELSGFSAERVLGSGVDQFHRNPATQEQPLSALTGVQTRSLEIGGRSYRLTAVPVIDEHNQRLGTAVEWQDRTAEVAAEVEVSRLVQAANDGDFSTRIAVENKEGFLRSLAQGINGLMDTSQAGLNEVVRVLEALARGDLTEKMNGAYKGTWGKMKDDANATVDKLIEIVSQIEEAIESINLACKEIAAGNSALSTRTEEQSSSLEETASSMEELTGAVQQSAQNAKQANEVAASASLVAVKGGDQVGRVVKTMNSINESSKRIVDIIGVIDGIAFQTNILALNAAVEAARAGEQGRGFAVVASEVRNLAQKSAVAAKEIKQLIGDSVDKVKAGTVLVDEAGKTIQEVVASVQRVNDIMTEMTQSSRDQSAGIEQINTSITQIDCVTQQNAALVEEAAAAAESLEEQADKLTQKVVAVFRLKRGITTLEGAFDFSKAAKAHVDWKHRLHALIEGRGETLDASVVACDDRCPLGQWIYGPGKAFANYSEHESLRTAHAQFHRRAGQVASLAQAGKKDEAQRLLEAEFEDESKQTIQRLHAMRGVAAQQQAQKSGQRNAEATLPRAAAPQPKPAADRASATILQHPSAKAGAAKVSGTGTAGGD